MAQRGMDLDELQVDRAAMVHEIALMAIQTRIVHMIRLVYFHLEALFGKLLDMQNIEATE
jgi:hypothetical protein